MEKWNVEELTFLHSCFTSIFFNSIDPMNLMNLLPSSHDCKKIRKDRWNSTFKQTSSLYSIEHAVLSYQLPGDPKKTSRARSQIFSWNEMLWRQARYPHVAERIHYLLRRCLVSLRYVYCPKNRFQKCGNSLIFRTILSHSSPFFGNCEKKLNSKYASEHEIWVRNRGQSFCKKKFPQTTSNPSLCRIFTKCWLDMMLIISL